MHQASDWNAPKSSTKFDIVEIIKALDDLIPEAQLLDPLCGYLLLTSRALLRSRLELQAHPCDHCVLQKEIGRLAAK